MFFTDVPFQWSPITHPSMSWPVPAERRCLTIYSDPDIQYLPFLAISPAFFSNLYSSYYKRIFPFDFAARFIIPLQHKLFYVLMLFARFNLYRLSYVSMFYKLFERRRARGGRWAICLEIIGIIFFWGWFGGIVLRGCGSWKMAMAYAFVSHAATSFLHVQVRLFLLQHHSNY